MHLKYQNTIFNCLISLSIILLISLGVWQLKRLKYKNHVLSTITSNARLEPIDYKLLENYNEQELANNLYRKIKCSGKFLHNKEIFVYAGGRYSKYPEGYILFTPLMVAENKVIIINRGFIPINLKKQSLRLETLPGGIVNIEGYLMKGEQKSWAIPNNDINKNIWFSVDLEQMQQYVGLETGQYFISRMYQNDEYPIGEKLNINIRNNHLAYALTWFGLAISLIVIYYLLNK